MSQQTIVLDFDGVIHSYRSAWQGPEVIPDPPVEGAFEFIAELLANDFTVAIMSTRSESSEGRNAMREWFNSYDFLFTDQLDFVECKPPALLYIDDRAYLFKGDNWPSVDWIKAFKPWNKV